MKVTTNELIKIVESLNDHIYKKLGNDTEYPYRFMYSKSDYIDRISFNGIVLWNSEDESREWLEEKQDYEDLEKHVKFLYNKFVKSLSSIKFKL